MKKKIISILLAVCVCLTITACSKNVEETGKRSTGKEAQGSEETITIESESPIGDVSSFFSDGDTKDVSQETPNATITLEENVGTISDTTRGSSGSNVTITSKGIYRVTGSSQNVTITVRDDGESGNVYLVLDYVTMDNDNAPCIVVEAADKVVIQCVGDNSLFYRGTGNDYDGAIHAKDDLTISGSGNLYLNSVDNGIFCKNDLKITGGNLYIAAEKAGLVSKKTIRVRDAMVQVDSQHDGIKIEGTSEENYFYMASGEVFLATGYDGIDVGEEGTDGATCAILLAGGTLDITSGGGSDSSKSAENSQKGLKCDGTIKLGEATLRVSSADDAMNAGENIYLMGGAMKLASSDDGIHADQLLLISGGKTTITKSYEGLEAKKIQISGGDTSVVASDDGINAAGGSDTSREDTTEVPWGNSDEGTLTISGGTLYVDAQGDGLDSNGSLYVTGGLVIVEGPTDGGNGALDRGDGNDCVAKITGGTVLALGASDMAINFESGTQCSGLVKLSGDAGATISVEDGSEFQFTTSKPFDCIVYSSPSMKQGNSYMIKTDAGSAVMNFEAGLYHSDFPAKGGKPGSDTDEPGEKGQDEK